jgi:uncharacterized damage-inducible protein DinB
MNRDRARISGARRQSGLMPDKKRSATAGAATGIKVSLNSRVEERPFHPDRLDAILYDDRRDLLSARIAEDARLKDLVDGYREADLTATLAYQTTSGKPYSQPRQDILLHLFNHQTHHRGQAHAGCSILTGSEPPTLDLLAFQRGVPAPDLG